MRILINNQQNHRRLDKTKIKRAARKALSLLEQPTVELSILFVDDRKMQQLNAAFGGISKTTDVLSFPQIEFGVQRSVSSVKNKDKIQNLKLNASLLLGDVVINVSKAEIQAKMAGRSFYNEAYHLLIHGILHLLGYDHEKSRYKARAMVKKEKEILDAIKKMG